MRTINFDDRLGWMLLGAAIGFVLGYVVRSLQEIKEELDEVDAIVKEHDKKHKEPRDRGDAGLTRYPFVLDLALLLVVILTVFAAFSSQQNSNKVEQTQSDLTQLTACNQQYLSETILALNQRTQFSEEAVKANIELQKAQTQYLNIFFEKPPPSLEESRDALADYLDTLSEFVTVNTQQAEAYEANPFPTNEELIECLELEEN